MERIPVRTSDSHALRIVALQQQIWTFQQSFGANCVGHVTVLDNEVTFSERGKDNPKNKTNKLYKSKIYNFRPKEWSIIAFTTIVAVYAPTLRGRHLQPAVAPP
jgi:hypothetical protein